MQNKILASLRIFMIFSTQVISAFKLNIHQKFQKLGDLEKVDQPLEETILPFICQLCQQRLSFPLKPTNNEPCRLCLGILTEAQFVCKDIMSDLESKGFSYGDFNVQIQLPKGIAFRDAIFKLYLGGNKATSPNKQVKTVAKQILINNISKNSDKQQKDERLTLSIKVQFNNPRDEEELFAYFYQLMKEDARQRLQKKQKRLQNVTEKTKLKIEALEKQIENVEFSAENLKKVINQHLSTYHQQVLKSGFCPPVSKPTEASFRLQINSIFLVANYVKLSRYLSQTPYADKQGQSVVEKISASLLQKFYNQIDHAEVRFHGGGREDTDVRMLFEGRKFAVQFVNPRKFPEELDIAAIVNSSNSEVKIRGATLTTDSSCIESVKQLEEGRTKIYCCFVEAEKAITPHKIQAINSLQNIQIKQKTPLRVLHQRTNIIRKKTIYFLKVIPIDSQHLLVYVAASSGTYIKQFVHGDLGRTEPNLGLLLEVPCDIFQLDVVAIMQHCTRESWQNWFGKQKTVLF